MLNHPKQRRSYFNSTTEIFTVNLSAIKAIGVFLYLFYITLSFTVPSFLNLTA